MKILIAAAAMGLMAGTAFAGEGNGDPFGMHMQSAPTPTAPLAFHGVPVYQNPYPFVVPHVAWNTVPPLPSNGDNAIVQTANSLPAGAADGTPPVMREQAFAAWRAHQNELRFAAAPAPASRVASAPAPRVASAPAAQPRG